jgi:nitrous oxidase accessory protein
MFFRRRTAMKAIRLAGKIAFYIIVFLAVGQPQASAEQIKVEKWDSLQAVINRSNNGDSLIVMPGVYRGNLYINKQLTIIGKTGATIQGEGKGNVVTITASNVHLEGLTIQNSGTQQEDSGIYLKKAHNTILKENTLKNVNYGIYVANSQDNKLSRNRITSFDSHFSKRGNGIHLFKGGGHLINENVISNVQDGIYFDFTQDIQVKENHVKESRYGMHFMFSEQISAEQNLVEKNITGFMVMDSKGIDFIRNTVMDHFHFRGFGILIYETKDVLIQGNELFRNSTGLSLEYGSSTFVSGNMIAANQVGLEFKGQNQQNTFSENNFIGNVVQSKIAGDDTRLDDGEKGNYWDDYGSFDLTGDGIGEEAYKAGSLYDRLLQKQPYWQFFFESPSIKLWTKAESLFPSFGSADVYDTRPLIEPVDNIQAGQSQANERKRLPGIAGTLFIMLSLLAIRKGRKRL